MRSAYRPEPPARRDAPDMPTPRHRSVVGAFAFRTLGEDHTGDRQKSPGVIRRAQSSAAFEAVAFLAAVFFAVAFFAVVVFFAAVFFAAVAFAGAFFAGAFLVAF